MPGTAGQEPGHSLRRGHPDTSRIDEAECRFLVGGRPLKTDKPLDEQVALTATQPPPSAIVDDGDEGDCSCSCMPSMG